MAARFDLYGARSLVGEGLATSRRVCTVPFDFTQIIESTDAVTIYAQYEEGEAPEETGETTADTKSDRLIFVWFFKSNFE